jgi:hypothetical protein
MEIIVSTEVLTLHGILWIIIDKAMEIIAQAIEV